jgi:hypothetical protein
MFGHRVNKRCPGTSAAPQRTRESATKANGTHRSNGWTSDPAPLEDDSLAAFEWPNRTTSRRHLAFGASTQNALSVRMFW